MSGFKLPKLKHEDSSIMKDRTILNQTQIQNLSKNLPIDISPSEIYFRNIQIDNTYEISILVKNLTKKARRIRVFQPKSQRFKCDYDIKGPIAAGLSVKLIVSFATTTLDDFQDEIKIISDDNFSQIIPIKAIQSQAQILFEPFINLGFIKKGSQKTDEIHFQNEGSIVGQVDLILDPLQKEIQIEPISFQVQPKEIYSVQITFLSNDAGIFKSQIEVNVEGFYNFQKSIDINATTVEYNRFFIDSNGQQIEQINFDKMYFGSQHKFYGYLVNNTPKKVSFKQKIKIGNQQMKKQALQSFQTPKELGEEQTMKIISCFPQDGIIDSYSQIPITFKCESKINDEIMNLTIQNAIHPQPKGRLMQEEYEYSSVIEIDNDDPIILSLIGTAIMPDIKLSQSFFHFGECPVNENRDIQFTIENNNHQTLDVNLNKSCYFNINPFSVCIQPNETQQFLASFNPRSAGKFQGEIILQLYSSYKIPLKFQGSSNTFQQKQSKKREINNVKEDFTKNQNLIEKDNYAVYQRKKGHSYQINNSNDNVQNTLNFSKTLQMYQSTQNVEQFEQFMNNQKNKNIYDNYIKNQRITRLRSEQQTQIKQKIKQIATIKQQKTEDPITKKKNNQPIDYEQIGINLNKSIDSPKLNMNPHLDQFYVNKKVGDHQPVKSVQIIEFKPDPLQKAKKRFPPQPQSHIELRDCSAELSGYDLQKIQVGPTFIKFGQLFIKSSISQTFWIRNDVSSFIQVQLKIENNEFQQSYLLPQIIPQGQQAGFDIVFMSNIIQSFAGCLKYVINDKYEFLIQVEAEIQQVKLNLNKQSIKCMFTDDNIEMTASETLKVTNTGNSKANFKWKIAQDSMFSIQPQEGFVEANSVVDFKVQYAPNYNSAGKVDEDKMLLKVKDGQDMTLKVSGQVNEFKAEFTTQQLNLGTISVYKIIEQTIWIQNFSRLAVFHVKEMPPYTEITPKKCKLLPDECKPFKIKFFCKEEINIDTEIVIYPRGGKPIKMPFYVQIKVPDVLIDEKAFDFGKLTTLGNPGYLPLTIINQSTMAAILILDLRESVQMQGPECMDIDFISSSIPKQTNALEVISPNEIDQQESSDQKNNQDKSLDSNSVSDVEQEVVLDQKDMKYFKISLQGNSELRFRLSFVSKEITFYSFQLPIQILGIGCIDSIKREVSVVGLKPRFILEPQFIEFKRKIISSLDKRIPLIQTLLLCNPDNQKLKWQIDTSKFDEDKIFDLQPNSGILDEGQQIEIVASFNPYKASVFEQFADLYIDDDLSKSQISIRLKGEGIFPRITFDRREIILPVVPIGIMSKCTFKIFNEGYDNYNLKYSYPQDLGPINIKLNYIEGKNLSVTTTKLRVEVLYKSNTSQSFTTKIEFADETGRTYSIPISGTTENSIFTNYSYLQRSIGDYEIRANDQQPIKIFDKMEESFSRDDDKRGHVSANQSNLSANNNKSILGYQQIPNKALQISCKGIMNWLNQYCLSQTITQFPQDFVNSNGSQVYEIITYFIGSTQKFHKKYDISNSGTDDQSTKYIKLIKQYEELVYFLKEQGGMLNSIRPHYLLSYQDFCNFQKNDNSKDNINMNAFKISEPQYNYILSDSWIIIVFQMIKIYQFSKMNLKMLKTYSLNDTSQLFPEYYNESSNLFSSQEIILIRWVELHGLTLNNQNQRICNLEFDLKDGIIIAQLIKSFIKSQQIDKILCLNENCQSESDMQQNCNKVMQAIKELGLQVHINIEDLLNPSQRDMLLFISQLYFTLPHYQPKNEPIQFECILGDSITKQIELNNSTQKGISYYVRYEGSVDFIIEESNFKIEPKSIYKFKVKFQSRVSESQTMRIWFTNRKDGNSQAAALVFDLVSKITDRKSIKNWDIKAKQYQVEEFKIQITNIFTKSAQDFSVFQVTLTQTPKKKTKKKDDEQQQTVFFMQKSQITIKRGETVQFPLVFIPLEKDSYHCKLVFCDSKVGEFQHEIHGQVDQPEIQQEVKPQQIIYVDQKVPYDIVLPHKNEQRFQAQKQIDLKNNIKNKEQLSLQQDIMFQVSMSPAISFISFADQFEIKNDKSQEIKDLIHKFQINICFNKPVINLQTLLIFESLDKKDVRVYKLFINIHPKTVSAKIEIVASLGETLLQDIPLINYSERDWQIKCSIQNQNPKQSFFTGPKEFSIKRKSTGFYPLSYNPNIITQSMAKLTFQNPQTNDVFEYDLIGQVTEPLAQEHIIIKCNVRQLTKKQINIKNTTNKAINYLVETDLISAWGESQFEIGPFQTYNYQLNINPLFGGIYTGQITFQDKDDANKYIWYTICINVERPQYQQHLDISCIIRKAVAFDIQLSNPLAETIQYEIFIEGEGLIGDQFFSLEPGKTGNYEVLFSPSKVGIGKGQVSIINEKLGEIWYELKLVGEMSQVQKLSLFKAEIGKFCTKDIILENNSDQVVQVKSNISNQLNYAILPENIQIQPFNVTTIQIKYMPTNIDITEQSEIQLFSDKIGDWKFDVQGVGKLPSSFDLTKISSQIGSSTQFEIKFKNPFNSSINIAIELINNESQIYKLLLKKKQQHLGPQDDILIPIEFQPQDMISQECKLILKNDKIQWEYPIQGIVDSLNTDTNFSFKTKARVMYKTQIKLQLPGQIPDNVSTYTMSIDNIQDFHQVIDKGLQIQDVKNQIKNQDDSLVFNVKFQPLKPLKTSAQLLITKNTGSTWRFNLNLEATEPDVDDNIHIFGPLNITSTISFKIHSKTTYESKFIAYYTSDSDPEFSIQPQQGVLQGSMSNPTNFYIQFTPIEYGKEKIGKIIIETDELYWSFNVIGTFPQYIPPQIERSVIDNWNRKMIQKQNQKQNFMAENINAFKHKEQKKVKDRSISYQ